MCCCVLSLNFCCVFSVHVSGCSCIQICRLLLSSCKGSCSIKHQFFLFFICKVLSFLDGSLWKIHLRLVKLWWGTSALVHWRVNLSLMLLIVVWMGLAKDWNIRHRSRCVSVHFVGCWNGPLLVPLLQLLPCAAVVQPVWGAIPDTITSP